MRLDKMATDSRQMSPSNRPMYPASVSRLVGSARRSEFEVSKHSGAGGNPMPPADSSRRGRADCRFERILERVELRSRAAGHPFGSITMRASSEELGVQGRHLFLEAVANVEPEVLRSLRQSVFPFCRQALAEDSENYMKERRRGAFSGWQSPIWEEFELALQAWARSWRLTDHWILEAAKHTAHTWDYVEQLGDEPEPGWLYGRYSYAHPENAQLLVEARGWEPSDETRQKAEERLRREAKRQIKQHLDRVETHALNLGYKPLPPHRSREPGVTKPKIPRHYRWLAEYQVKRMTQEKIADASSVASRTVGLAIAKLAPEIGLTLRSRNRG